MSARDTGVHRAFRLHAVAVLSFVLLIGAGAQAATPTPTPGPAARAGGAIDHAWSQVEEGVAQALLVARVHIALLQHLKDDALKVKVEVKGSAVELSGQVHARASQELARPSGTSELERPSVPLIPSRPLLDPSGLAVSSPLQPPQE